MAIYYIELGHFRVLVLQKKKKKKPGCFPMHVNSLYMSLLTAKASGDVTV